MEYLLTRYDNGLKPVVAYNLSDFDKIKDKLKIEVNEKINYYELPITFDIETSTIYNRERSLLKEKDIYEGFMYHWQICIKGYVFFGRTWDELQQFFIKLRETLWQEHFKAKLVCYVHNLSYEFQFMYNFFDISKVFATAKRKILKCLGNDWIEFRCSYYLSGMNLKKFIENTPNAHYQKAKGDLDFDIIRTHKSYLNIFEKGYCYNDVRGLYEAVTFLLNNDNLKTIPLTSTGYVRRECRRAMAKNKANKKKFEKNKLTLELYNLLKSAFRGGDTASNRLYTAQIINDVYSYDFASSYPFVMLSEKYPTGQFMSGSIETEEELAHYNSKYCTIATYTFENIRVKEKTTVPYIPLAKCNGVKNQKSFNGRILNADYITIDLTNIDVDIIFKHYDFDSFYVDNFHFARKDYLPKELREKILYYFRKKCELKDVPGKEYEYIQAKKKLNAIYGMMVTDILHDEFIFDNGEWEIEENRTQEQLDKYYSSYNSFLTYQWGVWVTAYARRNLDNARDLVGIDHVYNDTDSIKVIGNYDSVIEKFNKKLQKYCDDNHIINYVDYNGKRYYLGHMEKDGHYNNFITLGAKKYCYENEKGIHLTVSGLDSNKGAKEISKYGIESFKNGKIFRDSGRQTAYYNDDCIHKLNVNGVEVITGSNIGLVNTTYTLGMTNTMLSILNLT